jgi:hypothetical protein
MRRFNWPEHRVDSLAVPPRDHPAIRLALAQTIDHARAGRLAFQKQRLLDAKYHRDCCALLLWRLSVDGVGADGQIRIDGAKWETRMPERLSSEAARAIRNSSPLTRCKQSALMSKLVPDHIVPRNCVAETLIRPDWLDLDDVHAAEEFVLVHAEIAILAPTEETRLKDLDLRHKVPAAWWDAPLSEKSSLRFRRYESVGIAVTPWTP